MSIDKCPPIIIGKPPVNAMGGSHAPGVNKSMSGAFSDILSILNAEEATSIDGNFTLEDGVNAERPLDSPKDNPSNLIASWTSSLVPSQTTAVTQQEGFKLEGVAATQSSDISKDGVNLSYALFKVSMPPIRAVAVTQEQVANHLEGLSAQLSPDRSNDGLTHPIVLSKFSFVPTQAVTVTQSDESIVDIRGGDDLQSLRTIDKSKPGTDVLADSLVPQSQGERTTAFAVSQDPVWDVALAQNSSSVSIARSVKSKNKSADDVAVEVKPDTKNPFLELAKSDWRFSNERIEGIRLPALATTEQKPETLPPLVGLFGEYRQEKNSAGIAAVPTGLDVTHALGGDSKSTVSDSLFEKFSDYASPTSGDQNPSTYWMSSDMKNAEMQLEGLGEGSVDISISMQGNQAHVVFRSDEIQTRSVLEGAGGALRDMLSQQGLELGGVFVGAKHPEGGQDRRHQQESQRNSKDSNVGRFPLNAGNDRVVRVAGGLDVFV